MSWPYAHGQTVQVLDGSGANTRYGAAPWTWPVKATYEHCALGPRDTNASAGNENTFQRDTVETGRAVFGPPFMDVTSVDRIRIDGKDYPVDGEPQCNPSPFTGWNPGTFVPLGGAQG